MTHTLVWQCRGTMEATDTITDLASRPQHASFGPGLQGSCHSGMLQAAQWVLASVEQEVLVALQAQPCLDLMVTGHSMGGGIAALLALMLRHDPRLSMRTRSRLRAVCLAPAAVLGHSLAVACRDFVVSVINNNDLVPRVSIHSLSTFVRQVAAASPLQQAMAALARLMCGSAPRDSATATPGSSPGALATPSPAPHQLATNSQAKLSAAPLQTTLQSLPPKSELATLMSEFSSAQMPETAALTRESTAHAASAQYLPRAPGGSCATALLEPLLPPGTVLWLLPEQPSLLQRMAALAKHHHGRRGQPALAPEPTRRPAPALTTPPSHHSDSSNPGKRRLQRGEAIALQETACVRRVREGAEHVEEAAVTCRSKPTKGGEDEGPQAGQEGRQRLATCSHGAGDATGPVGNPQRSMWQWARSWAVRASESMGRQPAARQQQARGPGARLVLVVTEPDAFKDILFFSSAVADHMPTSYHKVLQAYLSQHRHDQVQEGHLPAPSRPTHQCAPPLTTGA
ncbi:hypothetical protein V8C86DRAFT_528012 [Haematococcus lacustris]